MGEIAALANAIIWAMTGVVTKGVGPNVRPTHIVSAQVWIGLLFLLTVGLIIGEIDALIHLNVRSAAFLAGGALVNTAGSLVFWLALSRGTVSRVYPTTQSVFIMTSVFAGWLFLGDDLEGIVWAVRHDHHRVVEVGQQEVGVGTKLGGLAGDGVGDHPVGVSQGGVDADGGQRQGDDPGGDEADAVHQMLCP